MRLHLATEERSSVSFHLLCKKDGSRLRNLRWCPKENREVPWDEVVRGYGIGKEAGGAPLAPVGGRRG